MDQLPEHQRASSINPDGSRNKIRLADVTGFFTRRRQAAFWVLIAVYLTLPFIQVGGRPAVLLDIPRREFFLFGLTFNAQDFYLSFFILSGAAFLLFYVTSILGRLWCGWACPQTVFLEGVFRRIERWIEGPRSAQILLARSPWTAQKILKRLAKHGAYLAVALVISHALISYFVPVSDLRHYVVESPLQHWMAFVWMAAITGVIYGNFAWFREQLCLIVCPYGKIQSALTDEDTLVIGYDERRGEPRGKKGAANRGACIDCNRCVDVCPTGIDIRNGLQLECIGCANCIDACDAIMDRLGQARGLIRYDSLQGLRGLTKRILRPRVYLYTFLLALGAVVAGLAFSNRMPFEANVLRAVGAPYQLIDGKVRNQYLIHLFNKSGRPAEFILKPEPAAGVSYILPVTRVKLDGMRDKSIPWFAEMAEGDFEGRLEIKLTVEDPATGLRIEKQAPFLGP